MSRWPAAFAGASLAFAAATAARYFGGPFAGGLLALLLLAVLLLIATGTGRVLLRLLGLSDISDSQQTLIGATLGLGILSLGVLGLAALHAMTGWATVGLLALLWLLGCTEMRAILESLAANRNILRERPLAAAAILAPLILAGWMAWVPPHQYDALVYHLPIAQSLVRTHGLAPIEGLLYSHFPQNGEMLYALALVLGSDLLAQLLMWLSAALSVWWVFEMGRREAPLSAVLLACFLLATHTSVMLLASTAYVEPLVMLWTTAAVLSFLRWHEVSAADPHQRSWLLLSAIFTGLALGTKYYAGLTAGLLGSALLARWLAAREKAALRDFLVFAGIVTALFAPWLVKNWALVGNPVFPFFNYLFPGSGSGWVAKTASGYFNAITEYGHEGRFWSDLIRLPVLMLTNDPRFGQGMDVLGGLGWELIFWFLPVAAWAAWRNRVLKILLLFCAGYFALWFVTGVVLRFLTVLLPLLCLLTGCGLDRLWEKLGPRGRWALGGAVGLLTLSHLLLFLFVEVGVFGGAGVLLGAQDREQYLSRRLDYYPCARWAAGHLGKNDRILLVGELRSYYVEQDHVASSLYAPNRYVAWANESASPEELAGKIRGDGFSALLLVPREAARLNPGLGVFTEKGSRNWDGLVPGLYKPAFSAQGCSLLVPSSREA